MHRKQLTIRGYYASSEGENRRAQCPFEVLVQDNNKNMAKTFDYFRHPDEARRRKCVVEVPLCGQVLCSLTQCR